jgi:hypothetical protein
MPDQRNARAVYDYVVTGREQIIFVLPGLKQREFEQRTIEWHRRALDGCRYRSRFLDGLARFAQVIKGELDIRIVDRPLEDLTVLLEEGGPDRFGLAHGSPDRPFQPIAFYRPVNSYEQAELPLRTEVTGLLREPYV